MLGGLRVCVCWAPYALIRSVAWVDRLSVFRYETAAVAPWVLEVAVMMICAMWSIAWWPGAGGVDRIGGQWLRYVAWMCLGIG